jgi:hypothetical protein
MTTTLSAKPWWRSSSAPVSYFDLKNPGRG